MEDNRLYTLQRRNEILRILREQGSISVNQLAEHFQVSGTTIRLDLTALEKTGVISRTHGGAVLSGNSEREPLIPERENKVEKERIAQKAVTLIGENDTILIDTGTTMHALAGALAASSFAHVGRNIKRSSSWDF
jgi:DeoR family fructose operon transcriptional repressor